MGCLDRKRHFFFLWRQHDGKMAGGDRRPDNFDERQEGHRGTTSKQMVPNRRLAVTSAGVLVVTATVAAYETLYS